MFQVRCLESRVEKPTRISAKYSIGPFLKGHSVTIFNAMRTVMLSNLAGIAVVAVRIKGIEHEFSVPHNTEEDVMTILLNFKELVLRSDKDIERPILVKSKITGPGQFLAKDIQLPVGVSFVDPRQYIATLTSDLEVEFIIAKGQGYVQSGRLTHLVPENFMALDGVFLPVTRVFFSTELLRTSYGLSVEVAILEICTNGTLLPAEALQFSSELLKSTFDYLLNLEFPEDPSSNPNVLLEVPETAKKDFEENPENTFEARRLRQGIKILNLGKRAYRCLSGAGVETVGDLLKYSRQDILGIDTSGVGTLKDVEIQLKDVLGLALRGTEDS